MLEVGHGRATTGTGRANLLVFWGLLGMGWHGRATGGTGRAKLLDFVLWQGMVRHGRATAGTGRAKLLALWGSKDFSSMFLNRSRTITYKITLNKQKQTKSD